MKKDINIFRFQQELATSLRKNHKNFYGVSMATETFWDFYDVVSNFFEFEYDSRNYITNHKLTEDSILRGIIYLFLYEAKKGMEDIKGYEKITIDYLEYTFKVIVKEIYRIFEIETLYISKGVCKILKNKIDDYHKSFNKNKYRNLRLDNLIRKYILF